MSAPYANVLLTTNKGKKMQSVAIKVREANGYTMNYSFECHSGDTLTEILEGVINNGGILEDVQVG